MKRRNKDEWRILEIYHFSRPLCLTEKNFVFIAFLEYPEELPMNFLFFYQVKVIVVWAYPTDF